MCVGHEEVFVQISEGYVKVTLANGAWKTRTSVALTTNTALRGWYLPLDVNANRAKKFLFVCHNTIRWGGSFLTGEWMA